MEEKRVGSGSSKSAGIGREMQNANFCHLLNVKILIRITKRTQNSIWHLASFEISGQRTNENSRLG